MKRLTNTDYLSIGLGTVCVLILLLIYFILGENSIILPNDQLDGEVIAYILHAKYLFSGADTYTEVMNGISANGLFPPAPFVIILYRIFPPFWAFVINQIFCMFIGFLGMYLLLRLFSDKLPICFGVSLIFAYLPLLSVYGLCQYGVPILLYSFYQIYYNRRKPLYYLIIAFYAGMSSLVLIGYALLGFILIFLIYLLVKKDYKRCVNIFIGWLIMLLIYILSDSSLLLQIFKIGEQVESHKEDLVRNGQNCIESFMTIFYSGTLHTPTHQQVIVITSTAFIIYSFIVRKRLFKGDSKVKLSLIYILYIFNFLCAVFYSFIQSQFIADFRNNVGGIIKDFQVDRVFWLTVFTWYFILGIMLDLVYDEIKYWLKSKKLFLTFITGAIAISAFLGTALIVFYYSDINKDLHRLRQGEGYDKITWGDYYATDLFDEIDEFIGEDKSTYRTLSLGIHPASSIYNGFYTLDAYSNNYALDYKHEFRNIIAGELDKDEGLAKYYDEWGCRCYVLSSELGYSNFMISKVSDTHVTELLFDTTAAKEMGAKYIFSAVAIDNASDIGLNLMREEPFSTDTSYYQIYLYEIL